MRPLLLTLPRQLPVTVASSFCYRGVCEQVLDRHPQRDRQGSQLVVEDVALALLDASDRRPIHTDIQSCETPGKVFLRQRRIRLTPKVANARSNEVAFERHGVCVLHTSTVAFFLPRFVCTSHRVSGNSARASLQMMNTSLNQSGRCKITIRWREGRKRWDVCRYVGRVVQHAFFRAKNDAELHAAKWRQEQNEPNTFGGASWAK